MTGMTEKEAGETMTVCRYCHCGPIEAEGDVCSDCATRLLGCMEELYQTTLGKQLLDKVIKAAAKRVGPGLPEFSFPTPREFVELCLAGLRQLAWECDGARSVNKKGFSKHDVLIGTGMSEQTFLSTKQQPIAARLIVKYRKQLSPQLVEEVRRYAAREGFLD